MSERDKRRYEALKADPVKYAAYLKRKREEAHDRRVRGVPCKNDSWKPSREYLRLKVQSWRARNKDANKRMRAAHAAIGNAIASGKITRPAVCSECGAGRKIQAHHHKGHDQAHWFDVVWLCLACHKRQHRTVSPKSANLAVQGRLEKGERG